MARHELFIDTGDGGAAAIVASLLVVALVLVVLFFYLGTKYTGSTPTIDVRPQPTEGTTPPGH